MVIYILLKMYWYMPGISFLFFHLWMAPLIKAWSCLRKIARKACLFSCVVCLVYPRTRLLARTDSSCLLMSFFYFSILPFPVGPFRDYFGAKMAILLLFHGRFVSILSSFPDDSGLVVPVNQQLRSYILTLRWWRRWRRRRGGGGGRGDAAHFGRRWSWKCTRP